MNRLFRPLGRTLRLGAVIASTVLTMVVPASLAQTPESGAGEMDGPHPAHIHAGTCAELGDVVLPLTDVAPLEGEHVGPDTALPVQRSATHVDMPLQEIIDGGHAINVHKSAEEIDVYIACGDIGGIAFTDPEDGDLELLIGLGELNDSGYTGRVSLGEEEGDQTEVVINLIGPDAMS